jgi:hypothetical protein
MRTFITNTQVDPVPVQIVGAGAGESGPDRETVVVTYSAKSNFTGATAGDTITMTQVLDVGGETATTVATLWRNQSTASNLSGAPAAANLQLVGANALTDGQLRASAVPVTDARLPAALGASTSANSLPVVLANNDAQIGTKVTAVTALPAGGTGLIGWLSRIWDTIANGLLSTNSLRAPLLARSLGVTNVSQNMALTANTARISVFARGCDLRFALSASAAPTVANTAPSVAGTATNTHFVAQGERIEVPALAYIAWIADSASASQTGTAEVTELS